MELQDSKLEGLLCLRVDSFLSVCEKQVTPENGKNGRPQSKSKKSLFETESPPLCQAYISKKSFSGKRIWEKLPPKLTDL